MRRTRHWPRALAWLAAASIGAAAAAPYRPADDAQVLERLPRGLPAAVARPADAVAAARIARSHIDSARAAADPRFLGYAQAALAPWWHAPAPPVEVLVLRATIRQARHDFAGALADLNAVLAREPHHGQALLTRATLLRVQGDLAGSARACRALRGHAPAFYAATCEAAARGLAGELALAAAQLDALEPPPDVAALAWWTAERADLAARAGDTGLALRLYDRAAERGYADPPLTAAHAQLLLDAGRAEEALALVPPEVAPELLRLRRAQALRALGRPDLVLEQSLADNFAAARRRGEDIHLREEARFELDVRGNAAAALELARANWRHQREPEDARLLAEAARVAGAR